MVTGIVLRSREQRMVDEVKDTLGVSLDLRLMLKDAFPLLLSLAEADYGALVAPRADSANQAEWIDHNLPSTFLGAYPQMAPHDFVLKSVIENPGVVMCDSEMITRKTLERNMMYQYAREVGVPLERVMAVMLHAGGDFQSGLSLYRDRLRPFSERSQRMLQAVTRALANAVRNCCAHARLHHKSTLSEAILSSEKVAAIVVCSPAHVLRWTPKATELLDGWFTLRERGGERLPRVLLEELAQAQAARALGREGPWLWKKVVDAAHLSVEFHPSPELIGDSSWTLVFHEVSRILTMPTSWIKLLRPAEREVTSRILLGWDNELIAQDLECAPNTVKVHVKYIFKALGVEKRVTLLCRALLDA